jgi:ABC-2 type transport system permease protein
MDKPYSQWRGMWAIAKASMKAIFRSPQSVFFSLFFPVVLIVIFGALSSGRGISLDIAFSNTSDTANPIFGAIKGASSLDINRGTEVDIEDKLKKGRIIAILDIKKAPPGSTGPAYNVLLKTTSASQRDLPVLEAVMKEAIERSIREAKNSNNIVSFSTQQLPNRIYRTIDFYLPGMLGFSLIGSAVFGVAFLFFALRETLVLKRMYATPIRKGYIVLGESIGRVIFQLTTAVVIILFGKFFYHFTLANGWVTFAELMLLSLLGLMVFMGFGFIISSVAKNQNVIPIYANLFMFPQYFLSGTFFSRAALPQGMQPVIKYLPLTALNDAMRKVSFEGSSLWGVSTEILILLGWCVLIYAVAIKVFKWD